MKPSMQTYYQEKVVAALKEELGCTNPHQVPRLEKIVVTTHCGRATDRKQAVEDSVEEDLLPKGRWEFEQGVMAYRNYKAKATYKLGERVQVRISRVNLERQLVDFELVDGAEESL